MCVYVCVCLPLGWRRIPRAGIRYQCYISPSGTGWRRTAPPTEWNRVWPHSRRSLHAQIWSTPWPQKICMPSCPDHGQRAPLVAWRSWCGGPAYRQHHLWKRERQTRIASNSKIWPETDKVSDFWTECHHVRFVPQLRRGNAMVFMPVSMCEFACSVIKTSYEPADGF